MHHKQLFDELADAAKSLSASLQIWEAECAYTTLDVDALVQLAATIAHDTQRLTVACGTFTANSPKLFAVVSHIPAARAQWLT